MKTAANTLLLVFCFVIAVFWTENSSANPLGFFPGGQKGGLPACTADLDACNEALDACIDDLLDECAVLPGDGYDNPDAFGVSGHGPALIYTNNNDGTFTDDNSGLMWEIKLKADGSEGGDCNAALQANRSVHCVNNIYNWNTALNDFLEELNDTAGGGLDCFAGYCDWCIPNIKKLQSIVDYSTSGPASSLPGETASNDYWSSTTSAGNNNFAWEVDFNNGSVGNSNKNNTKRVRAVRPCD